MARRGPPEGVSRVTDVIADLAWASPGSRRCADPAETKPSRVMPFIAYSVDLAGRSADPAGWSPTPQVGRRPRRLIADPSPSPRAMDPGDAKNGITKRHGHIAGASRRR